MEKMGRITVYYNGSALLIFKEVADTIGFKDGHIIDEERKFWNTLRANALFGIAKCKEKLGAAK
jgi:hypothetical protein